MKSNAIWTISPAYKSVVVSRIYKVDTHAMGH